MTRVYGGETYYVIVTENSREWALTLANHQAIQTRFILPSGLWLSLYSSRRGKNIGNDINLV